MKSACNSELQAFKKNQEKTRYNKKNGIDIRTQDEPSYHDSEFTYM